MIGDTPAQGARSDLRAAAESIQEGKPISVIAQEFPTTFVRYFRGLQMLHFVNSMKEAKEWRDVKVLVLWGATGVGKTRRAIAEASALEGDYYIVQKDSSSRL